ncbi:unnamed protein product [Rotaria socialis]|uniref:N-acetyltransferase domain-containing protein n=1 Tax=Rotaria socialis TaxID=392032 RepID=A0A818TCM8_9BILA|nr:unnamed protein product [Rotaria socialis]CAF3376631.1 unnamed protein product [Rotaria socialis]CAF3681918.1 unnamed protein product [Rotaria socialis]CAF4463718.1 unnamed protein product [Rotaria socialis]CAF4569518.1 unnamed protein product [Rotaria socialis]
MSSKKGRVILNETAFYYQYENEKYPIEVREAKSDDDFDSIVRINRSIFPHDNEIDDYARLWIQHNSNSPYFVITYNESNVVGYILSVVKGGYKRCITCELEQLAIDTNYHREGFASSLIKISLIKFQHLLQKRLQYSTLKIGIVYLTTGCTNYSAQLLYTKILEVKQKGAKICHIYGSNEYGEEEIIMVNENLEPIVEKFMEEYRALKL